MNPNTDDTRINDNLEENTRVKTDEGTSSLIDCVSDESSALEKKPATLPQMETEKSSCFEFDQVIKSIESNLIATKKEIQCINDSFNSVVSQTIELEKAVNAYYYEDGIKKLCYILEKVKRIDSEFSDAISEELTNLLINNFRATMINPSPGEIFNSVEHERRDIATKGDTIISCLMIGWRIKDHIIIRAIVETE